MMLGYRVTRSSEMPSSGFEMRYSKRSPPATWSISFRHSLAREVKGREGKGRDEAKEQFLVEVYMFHHKQETFGCRIEVVFLHPHDLRQRGQNPSPPDSTDSDVGMRQFHLNVYFVLDLRISDAIDFQLCKVKDLDLDYESPKE